MVQIPLRLAALTLRCERDCYPSIRERLYADVRAFLFCAASGTLGTHSWNDATEEQ